MESLDRSYKMLLASSVFKKQGFLCSVFLMANPDQLDVQPWQFDFYDKMKDVITSYQVGKDVQVVQADEAVFGGEERKAIEELDLGTVKVNVSRVRAMLEAKLEAKHESPTKFILILQKLGVPVWNVSVLTSAFNLINLRINAQTLEVLEEKVFPMLSWS